MKRNQTVRKRKWLNPIGSSHSGSLEYGLIDETSDMFGSFIDVYMNLRDCNRQVSLDFSFDNEKERKRSLKKLGIMHDSIKELTELVKNAKVSPPAKKKKKSKIDLNVTD